MFARPNMVRDVRFGSKADMSHRPPRAPYPRRRHLLRQRAIVAELKRDCPNAAGICCYLAKQPSTLGGRSRARLSL